MASHSPWPWAAIPLPGAPAIGSASPRQRFRNQVCQKAMCATISAIEWTLFDSRRVAASSFRSAIAFAAGMYAWVSHPQMPEFHSLTVTSLHLRLTSGGVTIFLC
jgi:hypothetical protein